MKPDEKNSKDEDLVDLVDLASVSRVSVTPIPLCRILCSIRSAPSSSSTIPGKSDESEVSIKCSEAK